MKHVLKYFIILFSLFSITSAQIKSQTPILSGVNGGSYNLLAYDIKSVSSLPVKVIPSGGSLENYTNLVANNNYKIAFMQNDVLYYMQNMETPDRTEYVKILLPLASEEIHLVTLSDNNEINTLDDLKGKRVAIGATTQGTNITAKLIKRQTKIEWIDVEVGFQDAFNELLSGGVDAFFFVGASPVGKLNELSSRSKNLLKLVLIEHKQLKKFYTPTVIKKGTYKWVDYDVPTFSVRTVLVANILNETEKDKEVIISLLTDIKDNLEKLQIEGHPKWKEVNFNLKLIRWPIHRKAKRIFR